MDLNDESAELSLLHLKKLDLEIGRAASRRTEERFGGSAESGSPYVFPEFLPYREFYSTKIEPRRRLRWELIQLRYRYRTVSAGLKRSICRRRNRFRTVIEGGQVARRVMRKSLRRWNSYGEN